MGFVPICGKRERNGAWQGRPSTPALPGCQRHRQFLLGRWRPPLGTPLTWCSRFCRGSCHSWWSRTCRSRPAGPDSTSTSGSGYASNCPWHTAGSGRRSCPRTPRTFSRAGSPLRRGVAGHCRWDSPWCLWWGGKEKQTQKQVLQVKESMKQISRAGRGWPNRKTRVCLRLGETQPRLKRPATAEMEALALGK